MITDEHLAVPREQRPRGPHLLGGRSLADGPFELHDLPGEHFTMMDPPPVAAVAAAIQRALDRVAPGRSA